jgi:hypothetical protein
MHIHIVRDSKTRRSVTPKELEILPRFLTLLPMKISSEMLIQVIFPIKGHVAGMALERTWIKMLGIDMAFQSCPIGERPGAFAV